MASYFHSLIDVSDMLTICNKNGLKATQDDMFDPAS